MSTDKEVDIFKPPTEVSKPKGEDYSKPIVPDGLIKYLTNDMIDSLKSIPENAALMAAEVLVSSSCFNIWFWSEVGKLQPNIWNQIILTSGEGKSVPIDYWINPILRALEILHDKKYPLIMSSATPESIPMFMNWHKETDNSEPEEDKEEGEEEDDKKKKKKKKTIAVKRNLGIWELDEGSAIMRGIAHKDYMIGLTEIGSEIYGGHIQPHQTISRAVEEVPYCYKAYICCTTQIFYNLLKNDTIFQGGENRKDTLVEGGDYDTTAPNLNRQETDLGAEREKRIQWYANKLLNITKLGSKKIVFDPDAEDVWKKFWEETKKQSKCLPENNLVKGYLNRQAEKALKRSVLYCLSKMADTDNIDLLLSSKLEICVMKKEMEIAIHNQRFYLENFKEMLKRRALWNKGNPDEALTDANEKELLWKWLTSEPSGFTSRKFLKKMCNWNDNNKYLTGGIESWQLDEDITVHYGEMDVREIIARLGPEWSIRQFINPKFRTPPYIYEVVDKKACKQ
jgi:hypothetical protein